MAETLHLQASARNRAGKGAARALRRQGLVPAVIYGDNKAPTPITLGYKDLWQQVQKGRFTSTLVDVEVDGDKVRTIPRDVQFDPVRGFVLHVDFLRLGKGARITVAVPVNFVNEEESPGLKRGGVLNVVRHEIEVFCPADAIPEGFDVDLTGLEIGDTVHVSAITIPDGVEPTISDRDFTICTIAGVQEEPAEEEDEEEVEAGEVPTVGEEEEAKAGEAEGED